MQALDELNYHHLLYFWRAASTGSVSAASRELHLTPQTVSAQVRALEQALGLQLFDRVGKRLVLTDAGRVACGYAEQIFGLGRELRETLRGQGGGQPLVLRVGLLDALPKAVAYRVLAPAGELEQEVRVVVREGDAHRLLADLLVHELDVVLTDAPVPPAFRARAFNHPLGECGVTFMAAPRLARRLRPGFPGSLDGAPFLLPLEGTALRSALERWFHEQGLRPRVVGEFADSGVAQVFGEQAGGVLVVPALVEAQVRRAHRLHRVGASDEVVERFYAISMERQVRHPAVQAICEAARAQLLG